MTVEDNNEEITIENVVDVAVDDLSDEQKTFLNENVDDLDDEQKETFKDVIEVKEEEEEEDVEPEVRVKKEVKPEEEEEETDPDDEAVIQRVVDKVLEKRGVGDAKDQLEVDALIRDKPEMGRYRGKILKYMSTPAYSNIPATNIASIVSAKDQQKIGAQKEREAAEKAKGTQGGGTTIRKPTGGKVDWHKASAEEVAAEKARVLGHPV